MEIKAQSIYNEETMKALAKIVIKQKLLPIYLVLTVLLTIERLLFLWCFLQL